MNLRELDVVKNYTGHEYDQVLGVYYAKARMYDQTDKRFLAVDPFKGYVTDPMTLAQYTYALDNPILRLDQLGKMSIKTLNLIKDAYVLGIIPDEYLAIVVLGVNVAHTSAEFLSSIDIAKPSNILERFREIEEELKDSSGTNQAIYLSFHEIAQVVAVKQISQANQSIKYVNNFFEPFPILESRTIFNGEMDIKWDMFTWEVKPGYTADSKFNKSLKKYVSTYDPTKKFEDYKNPGMFDHIPGFAFSDKIVPLINTESTKIDFIVRSLAPGKVGYFFQETCANGQVEAKMAVEMLPHYQSAFALASDINRGTQVAGVVAVLIAALVSPIPGDEIAALAALGELLSFAPPAWLSV